MRRHQLAGSNDKLGRSYVTADWGARRVKENGHTRDRPVSGQFVADESRPVVSSPSVISWLVACRLREVTEGHEVRRLECSQSGAAGLDDVVSVLIQL